MASLFDIDDLGNRVASRILFAVLLLLRWMAYFFPLGDPDLSGLYDWYEKYLESYSGAGQFPGTYEMPVDTLVYIVTILGVNFLCFIGMFLYAGLFIRQQRIDRTNHPFKPIGEGKLIFRCVFLMIALSVMFTVVSPLLIFLFVFALLGMPFVAVFCGCYLSGDSSFFQSFPDCLQRIRGKYMLCFRIMCMVGFFDFIASLLMQVFYANMSLTGYYVVGSFLATFSLLCTGRAIGMVYCYVENVARVKRKLPPKNVNEAPEDGSRVK